jgi:hypothetical protein
VAYANNEMISVLTFFILALPDCYSVSTEGHSLTVEGVTREARGLDAAHNTTLQLKKKMFNRCFYNFTVRALL